AQLRPQVHPIVVILGALGKQRIERADKLRKPILVVPKSRRQALIEIARGGVEGAVDGALVTLQHVARYLRDPLVDVDRLEAPLGCEGQPDFGRTDAAHGTGGAWGRG